MKPRALVLAAALAACGRSSESIEAERVMHAIDTLRSAPAAATDDRKRLVQALKAETAKGEIAVRARDACADAFEALVDGTRLEASVRAALHGGTATPETLQDLAKADEKVKESKAKMPACEEASAALRRLAH